MAQIQWFPGHMAKARREITESLQRVDAVLELVDARLPEASRNPLLSELIRGKPRVLIMTRMDMADSQQSAQWITRLQTDGAIVLDVDARSGAGINRIVAALQQATHDRRQRDTKRGIRQRPVRTMVVGIPNVGKSSVINRLAKRSVAKTGDKPGVTKAQQWIRLGDVELLDTPGVLWPKFDDEHTAYTLAISGAIKSQILDTLDICAYFIVWCANHYPDQFEAKYGVDIRSVTPWHGSADAWVEVSPILESVALRRGFVASGGVPNVDRCAETILREVQTGALGRLTFEWVNEETWV